MGGGGGDITWGYFSVSMTVHLLIRCTVGGCGTWVLTTSPLASSSSSQSISPSSFPFLPLLNLFLNSDFRYNTY